MLQILTCTATYNFKAIRCRAIFADNKPCFPKEQQKHSSLLSFKPYSSQMIAFECSQILLQVCHTICFKHVANILSGVPTVVLNVCFGFIAAKVADNVILKILFLSVNFVSLKLVMLYLSSLL